jgi:hypothetical protein
MEATGSLQCSQEPTSHPYPEPDASSPQSISQTSILISFHLHRGLSRNLSSSGFSTKIFYAFLFFHMHATLPAHILHFDLTTPIIFGDPYKLWRSPLGILLEPSATQCLLGPNILLSTLFSDTLSMCS